jgi:hypothetical protein
MHLSPNDVFGSTKAEHAVLSRLRVWGCPLLDPSLQDSKKIPKWLPRAHRGMFLGFSGKHSSTVGMVLNLITGHVSPQYHVMYNEKFSTVTSTAAHEEALRGELGTFYVDQWNDLLVCGYDRHSALDKAIAENIPLPELALECLTPVEIAEHEDLRRRRLLRRRAAGSTDDVLEVPAPIRTANIQDDTVVVLGLDTVAGPVVAQVPPVAQVPVQPVAQVPAATVDDSSDEDSVVQVVPPAPTVSRLTRRGENKNKKFFGDEWVNYQTGSSRSGSTPKIQAGVLDRHDIQSLDWSKTLNLIQSKDLVHFVGMMDIHYNLDYDTVE